MKEVLSLEIENLLDKVFNVCEEALDGNVPSNLHLWQLQALCRAAHYSEIICEKFLSQFKKVSFFSLCYDLINNLKKYFCKDSIFGFNLNESLTRFNFVFSK